MLIENLLKKVNTDIIKNSIYLYNNKPIPRVTHIISQMIHEEYLMKWANNVGIFKRSNYIKERDKAAFIGSVVHKNIEKYIGENKYDLSKLNLDKNMYYKVFNAIESFIKWFSDISNNKIKILGIEQPLTCEWFGGTYDMIIEINNKIYLTDFKTSNYISYKYFLQLSAYNYILKLNNYKINGFIILQVNKNNISYNEYVLRMDNKISYNFIKLCEKTFLSLVYAYYNRLNVENEFNRIFKKGDI